MPRKKQPLPQPEVAPKAAEVAAQVAPIETPEEAPAASPVVPTPNKDPRIEYIGEGAEQVNFVPSPKAVSVRVHGNGLVLENY
jgi:hypothetical protein